MGYTKCGVYFWEGGVVFFFGGGWFFFWGGGVNFVYKFWGGQKIIGEKNLKINLAQF